MYYYRRRRNPIRRAITTRKRYVVKRTTTASSYRPRRVFRRRRNPARRIVRRRFKGVQPFQFAKVLNVSQQTRDSTAQIEFYPIFTDVFRNSVSDKAFNDNLSNYAQIMPLGFSIVIKNFSAFGAGALAPIQSIGGNVSMYTFLDSCNIYPNTSQMSYQNMRDLVGSKTLSLNTKKKSVKFVWYVPKSVRRFVPTGDFKTLWNTPTYLLKDLMESIFGIDNLMVPKYYYSTQDDLSTIGASKISYNIEWRFYARFYGRIQDDDSSLAALTAAPTLSQSSVRRFQYPIDPVIDTPVIPIRHGQSIEDAMKSLHIGKASEADDMLRTRK